MASAEEQERRAVTAVRYRRASRKAPLPPGLWIAEYLSLYHALTVPRPGAVELATGFAKPDRTLHITRITAGWWRRWRLRLIDADGFAITVRVLAPGEAAEPDVGEKVGALSEAAAIYEVKRLRARSFLTEPSYRPSTVPGWLRAVPYLGRRRAAARALREAILPDTTG